MMMTVASEFPQGLLFVYGHLKQGFSLAHLNPGRRLPGEYMTRQRFPLVLVGPAALPCLLDRPGSGEHVIGQLFELSQPMLQALDRWHQLEAPLGFARAPLTVRQLDEETPSSIHCQTHLLHVDALLAIDIRLGPLPEFDLALAADALRSNPL